MVENMVKIALIQNQSTMSYSSKTDVRPFLYKLGYLESDVLLYTAHNIKKLKQDLEFLLIDVVLVSSNALNEKQILGELNSLAFKNSFLPFLSAGNGCLILHQARLAKDGQTNGASNYQFLPDPLNLVSAKHRGNESAMVGDFKIAPYSQKNPVFLYPNKVDIHKVKEYCLQKKALYWHYLDTIDPVHWDVLLHDENDSQVERPLLITSKPSSNYRIAVTSLNLDWQREENLLKNLLSFVEKGHSTTAILKYADCNNMAFDFLLAKLNAEKSHYHIYTIPQDTARFKKYIEKSAYQVVFSGPYEEQQSNLALMLNQFLTPYADQGKIKYLKIEMSKGMNKQFAILGKENSTLKSLYNTEIKIQRELKETGLIDGSFWMTVDTLKSLEKLKTNYTTFDFDTLQNLFLESISITPNGSYDGLISPTTALLWLRATYLGLSHVETQKTIEWLLNNMEDEDPREKLLVLTALLELAIDSDNNRDRLQQLLTEHLQNPHLSEIDLLHGLRASLLVADVDAVITCVHVLGLKRASDSLWIDLSISATIINLLMQALDFLKAHEMNTDNLEVEIETMVFPSMIEIQQRMIISSKTDLNSYLWENKANTTIKCISALLYFEQYVDLPISDITQTLKNEEWSKKISTVDEVAVTVIELFKEENIKLKLAQEETNNKMKEITTNLKRSEIKNSEASEKNKELGNQTVLLNQKLLDANQLIEQRNNSTNYLILALTSWLGFIIIVAWTILFLSLNDPVFIRFKSFYKDSNELINSSFLLVVALFTFLKFHFRPRTIDRL
jgi:hypothetical protein